MNAKLLQVTAGRVVSRSNARTRFDEPGIRDLAASIDATGCLYPPLCREEEDAFVLIDGERRLRAMKLLGWDTVPILVVNDPLGIEEALTRQLTCNLQRENLNPVDAARGIKQLMEVCNCSAAKAVAKLGYSGATASRWLKLLELPEDVLRQIETGTIAASTGYALAKVADPSMQAQLAHDAASGRMSREGLQRKLKALERQKAHGQLTSDVGPVKRVTAALGRSQAVTFVGRDLTLNAVAQWLAELLARANAALSRGEDLSNFVRTLRHDSADAKGARG